MLLLVNRDLGGSDSSILTTEAFQLRTGKLWPVITITNKEEDLIPSPGVVRQQVLRFTQSSCDPYRARKTAGTGGRERMRGSSMGCG